VGSLEVAFGALPALQHCDAELQSGLALLGETLPYLNEPLSQAPRRYPLPTQQQMVAGKIHGLKYAFG